MQVTSQRIPLEQLTDKYHKLAHQKYQFTTSESDYLSLKINPEVFLANGNVLENAFPIQLQLDRYQFSYILPIILDNTLNLKQSFSNP